MLSTKIFFAAACLIGLSGLLPVSAHHQASEPRHFLAFWSGYRTPTQAAALMENCQEGRFWERGFISIYSQGGD